MRSFFSLIIFTAVLQSHQILAMKIERKWGETQEQAERRCLDGLTCKEAHFVYLAKESLGLLREKSLEIIYASRKSQEKTLEVALELFADEVFAAKVVDYFFAKPKLKSWEDDLKYVSDDDLVKPSVSDSDDSVSEDGFFPRIKIMPEGADPVMFKNWEHQYDNGMTTDSFEEFCAETDRIFNQFKAKGMFS